MTGIIGLICAEIVVLIVGICFAYQTWLDDEPGASVIIIVIVLCISAMIIFGIVDKYTDTDEKIDFELEKINEQTYKNQKKVEDTCRAYISSYIADKVTYESCKDSDPEIAKAARIRANRTAATYNEYYLKNSFIWENNIPADIKTELEYLK